MPPGVRDVGPSGDPGASAPDDEVIEDADYGVVDDGEGSQGDPEASRGRQESREDGGR